MNKAITLALAAIDHAREKHGDSIEGTHVPQYERLGILTEEVGEVVARLRREGGES